jgi:hypothetical protein
MENGPKNGKFPANFPASRENVTPTVRPGLRSLATLSGRFRLFYLKTAKI